MNQPFTRGMVCGVPKALPSGQIKYMPSDLKIKNKFTKVRVRICPKELTDSMVEEREMSVTGCHSVRQRCPLSGIHEGTMQIPLSIFLVDISGSLGSLTDSKMSILLL